MMGSHFFHSLCEHCIRARDVCGTCTEGERCSVPPKSRIDDMPLMRVADAVDEKDRKDLLVGVIDIKFHPDHPGHMLFQACIHLRRSARLQAGIRPYLSS